MAQKCSYSRFENSGHVCEDFGGETSDLKDIPKSPRKHPGPERRPGSVALNSVDHLVPAPCKGTGETALSADDSPVHKSTGSQVPPAPTLEDRTSNHGASVVANRHPSCQSDGDAGRWPLWPNKGWQHLARNPWQVKPPLWTTAEGPYNAKWIQHKYTYSSTRPW